MSTILFIWLLGTVITSEIIMTKAREKSLLIWVLNTAMCVVFWPFALGKIIGEFIRK